MAAAAANANGWSGRRSSGSSGGAEALEQVIADP
jgi:hypothetical protein